jgi:hypothetical protein
MRSTRGRDPSRVLLLQRVSIKLKEVGATIARAMAAPLHLLVEPLFHFPATERADTRSYKGT